jgi:hypothetical protein
MYAQICLVTSVRGIGLEPITAARLALGVIAFMKAALGARLAGAWVEVAMGFSPSVGSNSFARHIACLQES